MAYILFTDTEFNPKEYCFMAKNVLGGPLQICSKYPLTGYYRSGKCDTHNNDEGMHTICALITEDFLEYSDSIGNDLRTPNVEFSFPGLDAGDFWCLCLSRWIQAYAAGKAPQIRLESTHASVLEFVEIEKLQEFAFHL